MTQLHTDVYYRPINGLISFFVSKERASEPGNSLCTDVPPPSGKIGLGFPEGGGTSVHSLAGKMIINNKKISYFVRWATVYTEVAQQMHGTNKLRRANVQKQILVYIFRLYLPTRSEKQGKTFVSLGKRVLCPKPF